MAKDLMVCLFAVFVVGPAEDQRNILFDKRGDEIPSLFHNAPSPSTRQGACWRKSKK